MYLSLIFLPLFGAFLSNRWNGFNYGPKLSIFSMFLTLILTLISFYEIALNQSSVTINLGKWIELDLFLLDWSFTFDILTISMFLPVIIISFLVQLYSLDYMSNDPHKIRFYFYLSIFTFFMLILICGDNLLILFLGWEGVGLASYLLIHFWFTRLAANYAALKAFLINRIGDWGLMLGILLLFSIFNDLSFPIIFSLSHLINIDLLFCSIIFLMIGAMAKSAQFGLHTWLSDAMEGPTPVSALIHAATMVTAGVYLLIRMSPLLEWSNINLMIIIW
jgi:NADH-ubiquinone oxidoreductase chain 5